MEVDEVRAKQRELRLCIEAIMQQFLGETGCLVSIQAEFTPHYQVGGPTVHLPNVQVEVSI